MYVIFTCAINQVFKWTFKLCVRYIKIPTRDFFSHFHIFCIVILKCLVKHQTVLDIISALSLDLITVFYDIFDLSTNILKAYNATKLLCYYFRINDLNTLKKDPSCHYGKIPPPPPPQKKKKKKNEIIYNTCESHKMGATKYSQCNECLWNEQ